MQADPCTSYFVIRASAERAASGRRGRDRRDPGHDRVLATRARPWLGGQFHFGSRSAMGIPMSRSAQSS